jgi:hypothetical protein
VGCFQQVHLWYLQKHHNLQIPLNKTNIKKKHPLMVTFQTSQTFQNAPKDIAMFITKQ